LKELAIELDNIQKLPSTIFCLTLVKNNSEKDSINK